MTDPKELLDLLSKGADPRKAKSLRVIHDVCEEQRTRGSMDLSIATIGRLSLEKGGPAAGAMRNATGEAYRALIKAHLDAAGGKKPKGKPHKADENPFEGIADPVLRARIGILLAENESLKGQLQASRNLANSSSLVDLRTPLPAIAMPSYLTIELTKQEKSAIQHCFSPDNLSKHGWHMDTNGRVINEKNQVIFKPGFTSGIKKILTII